MTVATDDADALGSFLSESGQPATHVGPRAVSLDDVLAREIAVQWDEAVAVVEELCGLLMAARDELPVPPLSDILISSEGLVTFRHGVQGQPGASAAGRTLHVLLSTANVPIALRLFVTQSTSPDMYSSIREFAGALAYFGKPVRTDLIRALYERCAAGSIASPRAPRPPDSPAGGQPKNNTTSPRRRRVPAWAIAVGGAASVLGAGIWLWSMVAPDRSSAPSLPTLISQTKSAIQRVGTEVRNGLGVGTAPRSVAVEAAATSAAAPAPAPSPRRTGNRRMPIALLERLQSVRPDHAQTPPKVPPVDPPSTIDRPDPADDAIARGDELPAIYSNADPDVRPPVLLYPQLPMPLMVGGHSDATNTMELVVSARGTVERVRLVAGPRRMPDMMLLSGAKMWRFRPAVRDGEPVRYRTVVSWIAVP